MPTTHASAVIRLVRPLSASIHPLVGNRLSSGASARSEELLKRLVSLSIARSAYGLGLKYKTKLRNRVRHIGSPKE